MATGGQERFWRTVRAWLIGTNVMAEYSTEEDPEDLLARAQREMQELHARNRDRAVQAITQKNNLQQIVDDTEKRVEMLQQKAELAESHGDALMAEQLRAESAGFQQTLEQTRESLVQASEIAETVKAAIQREEQRIRLKTSQAIALRTQWKALQLQKELVRAASAAREGMADGTVPWERGSALLAQAVRQRDELAELTDRTRAEVGSLRERVVLARDQGNEEAERDLLRQMEQAEAALVTMHEALAQAVEVTSRVGEFLRGDANLASVMLLDLPDERSGFGAERENPSEYAILIGFALLLAAIALAALWWLLRG